MATTSELDRVTAIVLRFMRRPILVLIVVYAIAISGLVLIPGQDAEGNPTHMSIFHAFYFLTYTATNSVTLRPSGRPPTMKNRGLERL